MSAEDEEASTAPPLRPEELDRLAAASDLERLEAFVENAMQFEEAWGLEREDGWVRFPLQGAKAPVFPLWPRQEFAALAAAGEEERPRRLSLEDLMEFVLPELARLGAEVAVFPQGGSAAILAASSLSERLASAWEEAD